MKIIIINGPTAIGKSTIYRIVHQELPLYLFVFLKEFIKEKRPAQSVKAIERLRWQIAS
jgi:deoxyadenosine/deoxycytidine kinase